MVYCVEGIHVGLFVYVLVVWLPMKEPYKYLCGLFLL